MQIERQILEEELTELHKQKDAAETEARIRAELEQAKAELSQRKASLDSLCLAYQDLDAQCQGMQQLTMTRASCEAVAAENKALFEKQLQRLQKEWTENEKSLRRLRAIQGWPCPATSSACVAPHTSSSLAPGTGFDKA